MRKVQTIANRVWVNQRNCFPLNVCRFLLLARLQWVEPAGGEQKSADIEQKMVTLIYPYPSLQNTNPLRLYHPLDGTTNPKYKLLCFNNYVFCKKKALAFN
jgi:hypothetical protein